MTNQERIQNLCAKELAKLIAIWNGGGPQREEKYLEWLQDEYVESKQRQFESRRIERIERYGTRKSERKKEQSYE